ncbi:hypothetical protein [Neobacillus cucumis]|uniref:Uncharacterized protein n=1 Tax=Neobacillus cucumis TaxID=1740721 RepID=A0A2N5HP23_9BACI|nr:hypothetical protein [Neobacillus cucumis]PLS07258.1 hypothetical protein CVD27_06155 [Neobacillus cucumis]
MKLKGFILTLTLLLMPTAAFANGGIPANHEDKPCDCKGGKRQHMTHKDWQAMMAEREQKLLVWVTQYTPDKKAEWTKVLEEKKKLRTQWLSPENLAKREQWKKERMAKIEELKKQFESGKMTKEEFIKQAHGGKEMGHWKTFHELRIAVDKKDNKQAAVLLNQLLEQTKQHNQLMKEKLAL